MRSSKIKKTLLTLIMSKLDDDTGSVPSLEGVLNSVSQDTREVLDTLSSEDLKSLRKSIYETLTIGGL